MRQKGAANKEWGKLAECGILEVMTQLFQDQFIEQPIPFPTDLKFCFYHVKKKMFTPNIYPGLSPESCTLPVYSALSPNKVLY